MDNEETFEDWLHKVREAMYEEIKDMSNKEAADFVNKRGMETIKEYGLNVKVVESAAYG
jgi:hypothetical protein